MSTILQQILAYSKGFVWKIAKRIFKNDLETEYLNCYHVKKSGPNVKSGKILSGWKGVKRVDYM